ncbi:outer membrane beta-barrel protein [Ferrimonas lipolytica]|uniref:Outer membrane protein beta-barrel domain-containing protein n=1 Tax=Ferrimonas lipolytica TaxID=2724191 RepID=A0A6H1UAE1_9GAMM|nr:outer membrane beta-barrel protein [Ferrimonas lipolytica]QIZ75798.1 hypothetical protein HER31_02115 [Ferrimonas lipolytica]
MKYNKVVSLVLAVMAVGQAQSETLKVDNNISIGYRFEVGDDSDKSNLFDRSLIQIQHRSFYDWGEVMAKYRIENLGHTEDTTPNGAEAWTNNKFFGQLYYNLGSKNTQLWFDVFTNSNDYIWETDVVLGVAQKIKLGKLNAKVAAGIEYAQGHNSVTGKREEAMNGVATRISLGYPISPSIVLFSLYDARWGRELDIQSLYGRDSEDGFLAVAGLQYRFADNLDATISYQHEHDWGGYNENGNNVDITFGYHF